MQAHREPACSGPDNLVLSCGGTGQRGMPASDSKTVSIVDDGKHRGRR